MISASLGAHYSNAFVGESSWQFILTAVGLARSGRAQQTLARELEQLFGGPAVLVYKGRDAIELALRAYGLTKKTDVVLTQAFTCYAIEEAIVRAGATPAYVDTGVNQLNLTVATLERVRKKLGKKAKAVIVQHSLGHPADITTIQKWCAKHSLLLIEDLAQSFGAHAGGNLLGTFGDAVILSFGRDKVIDAVSGGAVVFRKKPAKYSVAYAQAPTLAVLKDLAYPFWTWLIRGTYHLGIGKVLHKIFTISGLMTNPTQSPTRSITLMPENLARLALFQLRQHPNSHSYRQTLAALYLDALSSTPLKFLTQKSDLTSGALLRIAATVDDPKPLLAHLKAHNIHLADRWYRQPVDAGSLHNNTQYTAHSCPNAEELAKTVINLPTHQKIQIADAVKIIATLQKYWQK